MTEQPKHDAPAGMEPYDLGGEMDLGALSKEQQEILNKFKIKTRQENDHYLRKHSELSCLLQGFIGDVLLKRPENIREFAADYFTQPDLPEKLEAQLEERRKDLKMNQILQRL